MELNCKGTLFVYGLNSLGRTDTKGHSTFVLHKEVSAQEIKSR